MDYSIQTKSYVISDGFFWSSVMILFYIVKFTHYAFSDFKYSLKFM